MNFFQRFSSRLLTDELSEPNRIVSFIGIIFVILGFLYTFHIVTFNSFVVTCITTSGLLFILADYCQYFGNEYSEKTAIEFPKRRKIVLRFKLLKLVLLFFATTTLLIGPYIKVKIDEKLLNNLATSISLIAIGLTIYKISLDNNRKLINFYIGLTDNFEKFQSQDETTSLEANKPSKEESNSEEVV